LGAASLIHFFRNFESDITPKFWVLQVPVPVCCYVVSVFLGFLKICLYVFLLLHRACCYNCCFYSNSRTYIYTLKH
jgi:hypothetical protein